MTALKNSHGCIFTGRLLFPFSPVILFDISIVSICQASSLVNATSMFSLLVLSINPFPLHVPSPPQSFVPCCLPSLPLYPEWLIYSLTSSLPPCLPPSSSSSSSDSLSLTSTHPGFDSALSSCFLASPKTLKINEGCGERRGKERGRRRLHSTFQLGPQRASVCEREGVHGRVSHVCRDTHVHYCPCSPRCFICLS